jgi:hypothetical protein
MHSLKILEQYSVDAARRQEAAESVGLDTNSKISAIISDEGFIGCKVNDGGFNLMIFFDTGFDYWAEGWLHNQETNDVQQVRNKQLVQMADYMLQIIYDPMPTV